MGAVHAKEPSHNSKPELSIIGIKAKIQRINVEGLGRTKDDIVINSVQNVFDASDFKSALQKIHEAKQNLHKLGCFKKIDILIDTYNGLDAQAEGLEVTFEVKEFDLLGASVNTTISHNEGAVSTGGVLRNVLGRGEGVSTSYSYGTNKKGSFNLRASKPLHNKVDAELTAELYHDSSESPKCSYKQTDRGVQFGLSFISLPDVKHLVKFDNQWRNLRCLSLLTPFFVREQTGHSLKSSVIHQVEVDRRDQFIFPNDGVYAKLKNELAGATGGNIGFAKNELEIEVNLPLFKDIAIQGSLKGGHLFKLGNKHGHKICDRFLLGGPSSIRGFEMGGVGPHEQGYAIGGEMYWAAGLHLFTTMPFLKEGGLSNKFRLHGFVNTGNNGNFQLPGHPVHALQTLSKEMRLSYGAGIAMNLAGLARLELNYCIPLLSQRGDKPSEGLQFGISSNFL